MARLRQVTAQSLVLDPALVGRSLAPPWRRGAALLVDVALLLVPTWAVALGAAALSLWLQHPVAFGALSALLFESPPPARAPALMADVGPLLVAIDAPGLPTDLRYAIEHGDRPRVEALMAQTDFVIAFRFGGEQPVPHEKVLVPLESLIPAEARTLALFGVPALYFSFFHRGRRGATLGKLLLGIAVRRLDGRRLGWIDSLERFGGYFSVAGTLGIGLRELWRDPLRQLGHDKGSGTVVLLVRDRNRVSAT